VTSTVGSVVKQSQSSVTVRVRAGSAPQLGIRLVANSGLATAATIVSAAQPLVLTAVNTGAPAVTLRWSLNSSSSLDLSAPGVCATSLTNPTLVVNPDNLVSGAAYTFVLSGTSAAGITTTAMLSLTVGLPPAGGACVMTSSAAVPAALTSNFSISCTGWNTGAPPLTYAVAALSAGAAVEMPLSEPSPFPTLSGFVLPAGIAPSWNQTIIVYIQDFNGLLTRYEAATMLLPPVAEDADGILATTESYVDSVVQAALEQDASTRVWQVASAAASVLNQASLSTAAQLVQAVSLRERLLSAVTQVAVGGDSHTMSVVAQRLAVLAAVTAAPDQLSPAALQQAMDFLTALLNLTVTAAAGPDLGSTPTLTATAYLSALESVGHLLNAASASVSLAQTLSQPLVERVGVVAQTILSSLACGQTSSVLAITGGPALWTQKATLAAVRGGVITVRGAQFALPADLAVAGLGASECLGVQANEFTNNPYVFAPERFVPCPVCVPLSSSSFCLFCLGCCRACLR
jgi:hypothetical protein